MTVTGIRAIFAIGLKKGLTPEEIRFHSKIALYKGAVRTVEKVIQKNIKNVAMKSGRMRSVIVNSLTIETVKQLGKQNINVTFDANKFAKEVPYIVHHWQTGPTGKSFYVNPTTARTKPIKPQEWQNDFKTIFPTEAEKSFREQALLV